MEACSSWFLCPFDMFPLFFEIFFTFWHEKVFQAYLVLFLPLPQNQSVIQEALVPFGGEWYFESKI